MPVGEARVYCTLNEALLIVSVACACAHVSVCAPTRKVLQSGVLFGDLGLADYNTPFILMLWPCNQ